jgi:hypothetical protein
MTDRRVDRAGSRLAAWLLTAAALPAQARTEPPREPLVLRATFAAAEHTAAVPALHWWLTTHLPTTAGWPAHLPAGAACSIAGEPDARRFHVAAAAVPLPTDAIAAGVLTRGGRDLVLWSCNRAGIEDWYLPADAVAPPPWPKLLRDLGVHPGEPPRSVDLAVAFGHLAGARVHEDSRQHELQLAAALCGQVTWSVWRTGTGLRVRGRSDGGLLLPALLLHTAAAGSGVTTALPLRAFAARDGHRDEAARQLGRQPATAAASALRALLHGDDEQRLAAIDSLVRCGAADQLPAIVAAAAPDMPWAGVAATDAVQQLWAEASPLVRQRTRAAIARSAHVGLRSLPLTPAPAVSDGAAAATIGDRARLLSGLGLAAVLLYGLWLRERACGGRMAAATGHG